MGDGKVVPQLMGIVDREFVDGRLRLAVNAGVRLRSTTSFTDTGDMGAPSTNMTITASAELPVGFGAAWALVRDSSVRCSAPCRSATARTTSRSRRSAA